MLCQAYSRRDETIASALRLGVAEGKEQIMCRVRKKRGKPDEKVAESHATLALRNRGGASGRRARVRWDLLHAHTDDEQHRKALRL